MVQQSEKSSENNGRHLKIRKAAQELYELVKDEKRADGTMAFGGVTPVYSNLLNALNRGYIKGVKESPHVTWVNMASAEEYIMDWVEQASKTTGPVTLHRKKKHRFVGKRTHSHERANGSQENGSPIDKASGIQDKLFLLTDKDGVAVATIQSSGKWAASDVALKYLGYTIQTMPKVVKA